MFWVHALVYSVFTLLVAILTRIYLTKGAKEFFRIIILGLKWIPGVEELTGLILKREVKGFLKQAEHNKGSDEHKPPLVVIPPKEAPESREGIRDVFFFIKYVNRQQRVSMNGVPKEELISELQKMKSAEINPDEGRLFALVYTMENDTFQMQTDVMDMFEDKTGFSVEHDSLVREFHHAFLHENALNPMMFPSLRRMEIETVSMTAAMLNGNAEAAGFLTSGGTESILMGVKTFRDRARKLFPQIEHPELVCPITAHPAFHKAGQYFGVNIVYTEVGKDLRGIVNAMERAITPNTILLVASAPQYCHGIVDPIEKISDLAVRRRLPLFVDACYGGFMLPWVEKLGYPVPTWDFRLPGVMAISADIHKYGYGIKGASVIVYRNAEIRKHQIFSYANWPGGLFGSPSMTGTRPGGNIAASWATLRGIGQDGYMSKAKDLMETTVKLKEGIKKIQGLCILGEPQMTSFCIGSSDADIDIMVVADVMETKGWKMERCQNPSGLHCTILPPHKTRTGELLEDLAISATHAKNNKDLAKKGTAGVYGMVATIPDSEIITDFLTEFFSEVYKN